MIDLNLDQVKIWLPFLQVRRELAIQHSHQVKLLQSLTSSARPSVATPMQRNPTFSVTHKLIRYQPVTKYNYLCSRIYVCECVCMYMSITICIYMHAYMNMCIYVHEYICAYVYMHIYIYIYVSIYMYVYVYMYCIYVYIYMCVYICGHICGPICVYMYTYIHCVKKLVIGVFSKLPPKNTQFSFFVSLENFPFSMIQPPCVLRKGITSIPATLRFCSLPQINELKHWDTQVSRRSSGIKKKGTGVCPVVLKGLSKISMVRGCVAKENQRF